MPNAPRGSRLAWVESPLQLINAIEYGNATGEDVVIVPRAGVSQLEASIEAVAPALPVSVSIAAPSARMTAFLPVRRRLIGDVFSGQFRLLAALTGLGDLVIVDDGSATMHLAAVLRDPAVPFTRMAQTEGRLNRTLGARLRSSLVGGTDDGVVLFTTYDAEPAVAALATIGFRLVHNDYGWLAGLDLGIGAPITGTAMLGTALITDNQIAEPAYLGWVARVAAEAPVTYLPHRREPEATLAAISRLPGVQIRRTGLPVEFVLGASGEVDRVVTLPSSAVATLRSIVPRTTRIEPVAVPQDWWLPGADPAIRTAFEQLERNGEAHG